MRVVAALLVLLSVAIPAAAQQTHLLIISGLGGDPQYTEQFHKWATTLIDAALSTYQVAEENISYLAEKPDLDPQRIDGPSTKQGVEAAIAAIAKRARSNDPILIVLFGHGSSTGADDARINLPGPDLTAQDFAKLLAAFPAQPVAFVNTASASGGFVTALSGERRIVMTATKTGGERNETIFGGFFVEAFASAAEQADENKDRRVSMLEAYKYASGQVARTYENDGKMLTEHALLDDNGDRQGTPQPDPVANDGALARSLYMTGGAGRLAQQLPDDPELRALYEQRQALEERIDQLKLLKGGTDPERYEQDMEKLLVDLALKSREIRELEAKKGVGPR